ncbi:cytochrome P450 [Calycina marina]|uniref:Cytochrome P450 n=1 Tax=Calycina marina TaxID=1763456 RepID=A0A9P8CEL5_9HELO|nr:cytochrome P450 [Calycina marina]
MKLKFYEMDHISIAVQVFAAVAGAIVSFLAWNYLTSPIKNVPGPLIAKCTNWWRFFSIYNNTSVDTQRALHEKYGTAVQVGPNLVSLSDPTVLKTIYSTRGEFLKSTFYDVNSSKVGRQIIYNVFSTRSNSVHSHLIRPVRKFFTLYSLLKHEVLIDKAIDLFLACLDHNFVTGDNANKTCKMDEWLPFFAWDVIGWLTFGKPIGYLEHGSDFNGMQAGGDRTFFYFATIGQIPFLDHLLDKNPIVRLGPPAFSGPAILCREFMAERKRDFEREDREDREDMLESFMKIHKENPELMDEAGIVGALIVNVLAGGDTTGVLLCSILYYVLKSPAVYRKLMEELDAADLTLPLSYAVVEKLSYFDAVVKEAARMHPGVGLLLERVVPAGCLTLADGRFFPPGTVVGMNAWVIHQNKVVFGQDAAVFNPDRWLRARNETEEVFQSRLSNMKDHGLTFGAGKRVCMGRQLSILEIYKVMPTLFLTYEMNLVDPNKEWHVRYSWFTKQTGIEVKIRKRTKTAMQATR